ncbi:MAG: methyltransferase domain-containing protein [Crocinitomicaceae bacterium]|nr:methyltransferase domain-containing protein [Crocinitomicaceae bacterium]
MKEDYYHPKKLTKYNYNVYTGSVEILNFIKSKTHLFNNKVLDLGCGNKPYEKIISSNLKVTEYVGMDLENSTIYNDIKNVEIWNGYEIPLIDNTIQTVLITELLEHCYDTKSILSEIFRVIEPNGNLIGTVPFIWLLHETPNDYYRFTPHALKKILEDAGFHSVEITSFGGYNKALSVSLAIWLSYQKRNRARQRILRFFYCQS